jgi:hypothetical protein
MKLKRILLIGGAGLAALSAFGAKKAFDIKGVVEQLEFSLGKVSSWPEIFFPNIRLAVDVVISNPSQTPLDVSTGGLIKITKISVFDRAGQLVGEAQLNLDSISVPAFGSVALKNVKIQGPINGVLSTITTGSTRVSDFRIFAHVNALGREFIIES